MPGPDASTPSLPLPTVAVVGVGDVGGAVASLLAAAGYAVLLVSRRSARELAAAGLAELLDEPTVRVVPVDDAARHAEVVLLSVPYVAAAATLAELGDLTGTVVIDATNYNRGRDGDAADPGPGGTTAVLSARFPQARWVKSFNMLWAGWLRTDARPGGDADRVVFLAADDGDAKTTVAELIRRAGFVPFDTGGLADAVDRQLEGTPAWNQRLTTAQAARLMPGAPGVEASRTGGPST